MASKHPDDVMTATVRGFGPAVLRFAEYASGQLWRQARQCAIDEGLTRLEAEAVTALVVKSAVKALAGGINQARLERKFQSRS